MDQKTLILGISGGIAAYRVPDLISRLRKDNWNVEVILTQAAAEFVTPLTLREVSKNQVHFDMFDDRIHWDVEHITLAKKADLMAVIPATANIVGKIVHGIADDLLTTTIMAGTVPKVIAPSMNTAMYLNPIVQKNLEELAQYGYQIIPPETGYLLCGDIGPGKLASLDEIELYLKKALTPQDLQEETVLITAGGTREPIDPVRLITNRSSGKMGHALAESAFKRGAKVILVTTSDRAVASREIQVCRVETHAQMHQAVLNLASNASIVVKAAAPADYRPAEVATEKLKKGPEELTIRCISTPDILLELGKRKHPGQILVGFAAETGSLAQYAMEKLKRKNLDLIVGNLVDRAEVGMGADENQAFVFTQDTVVELPRQSKTSLADAIWEEIVKYKKAQVAI